MWFIKYFKALSKNISSISKIWAGVIWFYAKSLYKNITLTPLPSKCSLCFYSTHKTFNFYRYRSRLSVKWNYREHFLSTVINSSVPQLHYASITWAEICHKEKNRRLVNSHHYVVQGLAQWYFIAWQVMLQLQHDLQGNKKTTDHRSSIFCAWMKACVMRNLNQKPRKS